MDAYDIASFVEAVEAAQAVAVREHDAFISEESAARWLGAGYSIDDAARLAVGE